MCNLLPVSKRSIRTPLFTRARQYNDLPPIFRNCYSILFDQEAEKTQKLHVSVGKFPLLNKTFGVEFGNIFCKRCFIIITLTIEEEKDLRHCD